MTLLYTLEARLDARGLDIEYPVTTHYGACWSPDYTRRETFPTLTAAHAGLDRMIRAYAPQHVGPACRVDRLGP